MSFAIRNRIVEIHGAGVLKRSALSIRGGAGAFEWAMAGKGYRTAVEIGTYRGVAAAEMAQYCERVITIDLRFGKLERMNESFDRVAFWKSLSVENVELILIDDDSEKKSVIDGLKFDFAFIDGAHDSTVANDFEMVNRCGHVLFHDCDKRGIADQDHVYNFVHSLPQKKLQYRDIFALWTA